MITSDISYVPNDGPMGLHFILQCCYALLQVMHNYMQTIPQYCINSV